jgi:hypothetical protein
MHDAQAFPALGLFGIQREILICFLLIIKGKERVYNELE